MKLKADDTEFVSQLSKLEGVQSAALTILVIGNEKVSKCLAYYNILKLYYPILI